MNKIENNGGCMKRISLLGVVLCLFGCTPTIQSSIMPNIKMTDYKTAYLQTPLEDDFNMVGNISEQLSKMGYQVIARNKPDSPVDTDMLVSFNYNGWWDFGRYLESFQIHFVSAATNAMLGSVYFKRHGNFGYGSSERIADAFTDFKETAKITNIEDHRKKSAGEL